MVKCPECGEPASLVGLPNHIYPATYRCYRHGEHNFTSTGPESDTVTDTARATSKANAARYGR